ncbi:MAG TPA: MAPEG family protein [Candidatus Acidoferrales bacterium]|nr:MAPEG family protein [Candidatus Acidoferrales bacterium]
MTVAIVCTAMLGLLLFALGLNVSRSRGVDKAGAYPNDPADPFFKSMRAHANTAEYAPMLAVLMLIAGERNPGTWVLWTMGIAVASRYLIVAGMLASETLAKPHPLRFVGATGTYLTGIALCVAVLMSV